MSDKAKQVVIKTAFNGDIRRITDHQLSFERLCSRVKQLYGLPPATQLILRYMDEEGDLVTISSDAELLEASYSASGPMKLHVFASSEEADAAKSFEFVDIPESPAVAQPPEQREKVVPPSEQHGGKLAPDEAATATAEPPPHHAEPPAPGSPLKPSRVPPQPEETTAPPPKEPPVALPSPVKRVASPSRVPVATEAAPASATEPAATAASQPAVDAKPASVPPQPCLQPVFATQNTQTAAGPAPAPAPAPADEDKPVPADVLLALLCDFFDNEQMVAALARFAPLLAARLRVVQHPHELPQAVHEMLQTEPTLAVSQLAQMAYPLILRADTQLKVFSALGLIIPILAQLPGSLPLIPGILHSVAQAWEQSDQPQPSMAMAMPFLAPLVARSLDMARAQTHGVVVERREEVKEEKKEVRAETPAEVSKPAEDNRDAAHVVVGQPTSAPQQQQVKEALPEAAQSAVRAEDIKVEDAKTEKKEEKKEEKREEKTEAPSQPQCSAEPEPQLPCMDELMPLLVDFFNDQQVQEALLRVAPTIQPALQPGQPGSALADALAAALASEPALESSRLAIFLTPLIPLLAKDSVQPCLQAVLPVIASLFSQLPSLLPRVPYFLQMASNFQQLASFLSLCFSVPQPAFATEEEEENKEENKESKTEEASAEPQPVLHVGVTCDGCQKQPIEGVRFKCSVCPDYDLCEACEKKNLHFCDHPLIRYTAPVHFGVACNACRTQPIVGTRYKCMVCRDFDLCAECEAKANHPNSHPLLKLKQPRVGVAHFSPPPGLFARIFPTPATTCDQEEGRGSRKNPEACFAADVTIPDNSILPPNIMVTKTWRLKNVGARRWPKLCTMVHVGGDNLGIQSMARLIPRARPGEEVDVSVDILTPSAPGHYKALYRLSTARGQRFGHSIWVEFNVVKSEDKPVPPPAPIPTFPGMFPMPPFFPQPHAAPGMQNAGAFPYMPTFPFPGAYPPPSPPPPRGPFAGGPGVPPPPPHAPHMPPPPVPLAHPVAAPAGAMPPPPPGLAPPVIPGAPADQSGAAQQPGAQPNPAANNNNNNNSADAQQQPALPDGCKFPEQVAVLHSMGFMDTDRCVAALEMAGGDMTQAVQLLVQYQPQPEAQQQQQQQEQQQQQQEQPRHPHYPWPFGPFGQWAQWGRGCHMRGRGRGRWQREEKEKGESREE